MFFVTEHEVQEQDGIPEYYLLPRHIELLAKNKEVRQAILQRLKKKTMIIAGVEGEEESTIPFLDLLEQFDSGSGFHSKL